jgi:hypothetical protein
LPLTCPCRPFDARVVLQFRSLITGAAPKMDLTEPN